MVGETKHWMNNIVSDKCIVKLRITESVLPGHNALGKILPWVEGYELPHSKPQREFPDFEEQDAFVI